MALTVNGTGLTMPNIDVSRAGNMVDWNGIGSNLGRFSAGLRKHIADNEYADILEGKDRMDAIRQEIAQLKSENERMQQEYDQKSAQAGLAGTQAVNPGGRQLPDMGLTAAGWDISLGMPAFGNEMGLSSPWRFAGVETEAAPEAAPEPAPVQFYGNYGKQSFKPIKNASDVKYPYVLQDGKYVRWTGN